MNTAGLTGGILAAVASFRPSLVARSTGHQAVLMGTSASMGYAIGHVSAKALRRVSRALESGTLPGVGRAAGLGGSGGAAADTAAGAARLVMGPLGQAAGSAAGDPTGAGPGVVSIRGEALAHAAGAALAHARDLALARIEEKALSEIGDPGLSGLTSLPIAYARELATAGRRALPSAVDDPDRAPVWVGGALVAAACVAAVPAIVARAEQERQIHADWGVAPMRPGVAVLQGTAMATAVVAGGHAASAAVATGARRASERFGGPPQAYSAGAALVGGGAVVLAYSVGVRRILDRLTAAGRAFDPAFANAPTNPHVSGGPGSLVPYSTHSREGARLVHLTNTSAGIEQVIGRPAQAPIRVFVGVSAAQTPDRRVDLAMAELERLGAFGRRYLLVASPAGSGYVNPVPVEALEMMAAGDCATVAVQYGVLPSMFSKPALPDAALTFRLLLDAVLARRGAQGEGDASLILGEAGRLPLVLAYGESLGSQAAQSGLCAPPSRWAADGSFEGVSAALFVGTPAGAGVRATSADKPAVLVVDRWQDVGERWMDTAGDSPGERPPGVRVLLLDHDADPVTRWESSLVWARPDWLASRPRGRGIPEGMAWRPLLTYLQVFFDVARATQPQLGVFQSHGHDYRADLAAVVRAAFSPGTPDELLTAVEEQLVRNEVHRAELLAQK